MSRKPSPDPNNDLEGNCDRNQFVRKICTDVLNCICHCCIITSTTLARGSRTKYFKKRLYVSIETSTVTEKPEGGYLSICYLSIHYKNLTGLSRAILDNLDLVTNTSLKIKLYNNILKYSTSMGKPCLLVY